MCALNLNPAFKQSALGVSASTINPDADLPLPTEIGLPARYEHWRVNQADAVERILNSTKRFIVLCCPTGYGKSGVVVGAALLSGRRSVLLTNTRGLQDQVSGEFSGLLSDIRGLENYACPIAAQLGVPPTTTVADAPCQCGYRCRLKLGGGCGYYDAYRSAQRAEIVCTNYQCWFHDGRKDSEQMGNLQFGTDAKKDSPIGILFCDEGHAVPEALSLFVGIDLSRSECLQLHLAWLDAGATVDEWREWACDHIESITDRAKSIEDQLRGASSNRWSKDLKKLRDMKRKLERLMQVRVEDEWIVTETDVNASASTMSAVRFDPLSPARYAESALFRGIEKIVLVSATVRPKTAMMLGIEAAEMEFVEYPSTFPVERRPVIHTPSIRMTYHTEQNDDLMTEWLRVFDSIVGPRMELGWKGIAHCVSYRRAKFIHDNSAHSRHMMTHSTYNREKVVSEFRQSAGPRVLLSPSVDTGYDFPNESCRFQIIVKIPFSSVTDPVVKARKQRDADYDLYQAAQTLVQATGRPVRSESDWAESFILDDSLSWCLPKMKAKGFLPKWWLAAFRSVDAVPEPMQVQDASASASASVV